MYSFLEWLSSFSSKNYDFKELSTTGTVKTVVEKEGGYVITTKTWTSEDGNCSVTEIKTEQETDLDINSKLEEFNRLIAIAVEQENYEEAANLKKQKEELLNNKSK